MAQAVRKSTIPRYYAIWRTLWSRITSGYYPAGSLLGTEVAMAAEFGVSRVTLREALSLLEGEGLIERRRSFGTFVASDVVPRGVVEFTGYLEDIMLQAESATTEYFKRAVIPASPAIAKALQVAEGTEVVQVKRLRVTEGQPRIWLIDYLPRAIGDQFTDDELQTRSVMQRLDEGAGTRIGYGHQTIAARTGSVEVCERLGLDPASVVLYSDRIIFDLGGKPLSYVEMFYPGDRFSFEIRLGRI
jgi:GntR family transcriptional regulator